jgi:predicted ATPase
LLVVEDLHWTDSASGELLTKIIDGGTLRISIITTRRPEYSPLWLDRSSVNSLPLQPLKAGDLRDLIQQRLSVAALPEGLTQQVIQRAEGNPLFAEEIVSYLIERSHFGVPEVRRGNGATLRWLRCEVNGRQRNYRRKPSAQGTHHG